MKRWPVAVVALLLLGVSSVFLFLRDRGPASTPLAIDAAPAERPAKPDRPRETAAAPRELEFAHDDDPPGALRVEGQVIDAAEQGVGGARVTVSSNPPREIRAEADGSFVFEKLLPRVYAFTAIADEGIAPPVSVRLTAKPEPVILRVRPASTLAVAVIDGATRKPVAGADVLVEGPGAPAPARSDRAGQARLRPVGAGYHMLRAEAPGYATARQGVLMSGAAGAILEETIELLHGAPLSGLVVDAAGAPVAGATVRAIDTGDILTEAEERSRLPATNEKGEFRFAALRAGTYRFRAEAARRAPGTTSPLTVDGRNERSGVVIRLEAGGHVTGSVVDAAGAAAPFASIRLADAGAGYSFDLARSATADEKGVFDVDGLPRAALEIVAVGAEATSENVAVDLRATAEKTGLVLRLDINGAISGVVVDSRGAPVPESQVLAIPEDLAGPQRDLRLRGLPRDVADAGGRFTLTGLRAGSYRLRASRGDISQGGAFWLRPGVPAQTGATDARIVIEADGAVAGKVLFADGTPATVFTISVARGLPTPFSAKDGAFRLGDVPPGTHILVVSGPGFAEKIVPDVTVKEGADTDAGTITVEKGRSISGRVLDASGAGVEGATVVAGIQLIGSGDKVTTSFPGGRMRSATSEAGGEFYVGGVGPGRLLLVAEERERGRSQVVQVPAGDEPLRFDLVLLAPGSLEGIVTRVGAPVGDAVVVANQQGASRGQFIATTGDDGRFRYEKLTPGGYRIIAALQGGGRGAVATQNVVADVVAGQTTTANIDIPGGGVLVRVSVVLAGGGEPPAAIVLLASGRLDARNTDEIQIAEEARGAGSTRQTLVEGKAAEFPEVAPGAYSVCGVALPGSITDPKVIQRLQTQDDPYPAFCQPLVVVATTATHEVTITVPSAAPPPPKQP